MPKVHTPFDSFPAEYNWPLRIEQEFGHYPAVRAYLDAKFSRENDDARSVYRRLYDFHNTPANPLAEEFLEGLSHNTVWPPFFKSQSQASLAGKKIEYNVFQCAVNLKNSKLLKWWEENGYTAEDELGYLKRKLSTTQKELKAVKSELSKMQMLQSEKKAVSVPAANPPNSIVDQKSSKAPQRTNESAPETNDSLKSAQNLEELIKKLLDFKGKDSKVADFWASQVWFKSLGAGSQFVDDNNKYCVPACIAQLSTPNQPGESFIAKMKRLASTSAAQTSHLSCLTGANGFFSTPILRTDATRDFIKALSEIDLKNPAKSFNTIYAWKTDVFDCAVPVATVAKATL